MALTLYRRDLLTLLGIFCLTVPAPLGLRATELSMLSLAGVLLLTASHRISLTRIKEIGVLLVIAIGGTAFNYWRGEPVSEFQFFRLVVFPLVALWLAIEEFDKRFFTLLELWLPIMIGGAYMSAFLYFVLGTNFYNSHLDIPFEESEYKRLFVYPMYFFLILFVEAVLRNRLSQLIYLPLLLMSMSKSTYLAVGLTYALMVLRVAPLRRASVGFLMLAFVMSAIFLFGLWDRIVDFIEQGDPWRVEEPLAALEWLQDPIRFAVGNGSGVKYWDGRGVVAHLSWESEMARVNENSAYDVHNGFVTLLMRFGAFGACYYVFLFFRTFKFDSRFDRFVLYLIVALNTFLSHGPVQTVESVGLVLGMRMVLARQARRHKEEGT